MKNNLPASISRDSTPGAFPALRRDLEIVPFIEKGKGLRYLVRLPDSKEGFELGEREYFLSTQLDGRTPLDAIEKEFRERFGVGLQPRHLEAFARNLASLGLLAGPRGETTADTAVPKTYALCRPDTFFRFLAAGFSWCFSSLFLLAVVGLTFIALGITCKYGPDLLYVIGTLWNPSRLLFLCFVPLFGFLLVYPLGELAKGIACCHYGGQVPEFSVGFVFKVIPRFSVHIWDSLWFFDKNQRLRVFAAGPLSQLILLNLALLGLHHAEPFGRPSLCWGFLLLASLFYLLLNLNPLLQRDGYFLLVNWLEIQDLKSRSEALARRLFSLAPLPEPLSRRDVRTFAIYGSLSLVFSLLFSWLVLGTMGNVLIDSFQGVGALLALLLVWVRYEEWLKKQWEKVPVMGKMLTNEGGTFRVRLLVKLTLLLVGAVVLFLPYPFEAGGDFEVLPAHQMGIRAEVAGILKEVLVEENQTVVKGQEVAVLDDRLQRTRIEALQASLEESRALVALRRKGAKPEEIAKARQEVASAEKAVKFSALEAERYKKMFDQQAVPETEYQYALRKEQTDRETLEIAKKNLALVESGARSEEIVALEAEMRRVEVELRHAEQDLLLTTLHSPMDGMIVTPYLKQMVGQRLEMGELFATVENTGSYLAEIEIPEEDASEIRPGARVRFRTWSDPTETLVGHVTSIAPVTYEKSLQRKDLADRVLSQRESLVGQKEVLRARGKVLRILAEFPNPGGALRSNMTGYAKIECDTRIVAVAFTRWLVRLFNVEIWSWIP